MEVDTNHLLATIAPCIVDEIMSKWKKYSEVLIEMESGELPTERGISSNDVALRRAVGEFSALTDLNLAIKLPGCVDDPGIGKKCIVIVPYHVWNLYIDKEVLLPREKLACIFIVLPVICHLFEFFTYSNTSEIFTATRLALSSYLRSHFTSGERLAVRTYIISDHDRNGVIFNDAFSDLIAPQRSRITIMDCLSALKDVMSNFVISKFKFTDGLISTLFVRGTNFDAENHVVLVRIYTSTMQLITKYNLIQNDKDQKLAGQYVFSRDQTSLTYLGPYATNRHTLCVYWPHWESHLKKLFDQSALLLLKENLSKSVWNVTHYGLGHRTNIHYQLDCSIS
nr:MAG: hypothetical protein [Halyomorpha halys reo-like associated virus 1]